MLIANLFIALTLFAASAVAIAATAATARLLARLLELVSGWCSSVPDEFLRGGLVVPCGAGNGLDETEDAFDLLGHRLPNDAAHLGTLLVGVPGTGKTVVATGMVSSLCRRFDRSDRRRLRRRAGERLRLRLVIFDAKNEWPAKVHRLLPPWVPVYQLNPLDAARGVRWAVADDVRSVAEALQLASGVAPDRTNDPNGFFTRASRNALTDLALVLLLTAGKRWRAGHLAALTRNQRLLAAVLRSHPITRDTAAQMLRGRSGKDVLATIGTFVNALVPAFSGWDRCAGTVSIRQFLDEEAVLILGWDDGVSDALSPLYTLFLRLLIDRVLLNADPTDRTWLFLDELGLLGKLDALPRAVYRGRSSALCVTAGVQDVNTLDRIYGRDMAREILASLQTKVFFRLGSKESAEFAAGAIGKQEVRRWLRSYSHTRSGNGGSSTTGLQEQIAERYAVMPDELLHLPLADPVADRLTGYLLSPFVGGTARFEVPFLASARASAGDPSFENYRRRDAADQLPLPLSPADVEALGVPLTDEVVAALVRSDR